MINMAQIDELSTHIAHEFHPEKIILFSKAEPFCNKSPVFGIILSETERSGVPPYPVILSETERSVVET